MKKTRLLLCLASVSLLLSACRAKPNGGDGEGDGGGGGTPTAQTYTYKTYTAVSPSDWNELSLQDANDRQIQGYISGSLFTFNYKFEEGHYGERDHIVQGDFSVEYDGATKLEDVTTTYAGNEKYAVPADATEGYAYKITLRDDLKWDDGTPIKADDFVYSMKAQLDPRFIFRNSDQYYKNSIQIHNAQPYLKQGQNGYFPSDEIYPDGYAVDLDSKLVISIDAAYQNANSPFNKLMFEYQGTYGFAGDTASEIANNAYGEFGLTSEEIAKLEGKTVAAIKADAELAALLATLIEWWDEGDDGYIWFSVAQYTFPAVDWNDVGMFKGENDLEIIVVLDKTLMLLEDGEICFKTAYNFSTLPLVHRTKFEANIKEPVTGSTLYTSKYCSDVASTASWGPYKLTNFQAGKHYELEKNPNWYGWNMKEYKGQYQAEKIVCETIAEFETAWQLFQKGDLSDIGLNVTIAQEYNKSSRAFFSGDDYIYTLQIQSDAAALKGRETENVDKEMLNYVKFRKAMSLAVDRAAYASATTTASQAGFGLFNMYHYYDIEHGKAYRNEDVAKQVLCEVYGVDVSEYESLDAAYAAVDGYDLTQARQLVREAYQEALDAGTIDADDNVVLTYGSSTDNANVRRYLNNLEAFLVEMVKETPLEGRLSLEFKDFGDRWSKDFRAGAYDLTLSGWSGGAWDPGYFIGAYLEDGQGGRYAQGWEPRSVTLTYNPWGDEEGEHRELSMNLVEWYDCLNGNQDADYDWSEGKIDNAFRLGIIAQLEKEVLLTYYAVPLMYWYGATILSYQVDYGSAIDNPVLGFGGFRYLVFNYSDQEWESRKTSYDYRK